MAAEFKGRIKLVKVNSDDNPELSQAYGIRSIPNVIAFKDGRPAAQFVGAQPEQQVRTFMEKLLPSQMEEALKNAEALLAAGNLDDAERQLAVIKPDLANAARIEAVASGHRVRAQRRAGSRRRTSSARSSKRIPPTTKRGSRSRASTRASAATKRRWTSCSRS